MNQFLLVLAMMFTFSFAHADEAAVVYNCKFENGSEVTFSVYDKVVFGQSKFEYYQVNNDVTFGCDQITSKILKDDENLKFFCTNRTDPWIFDYRMFSLNFRDGKGLVNAGGSDTEINCNQVR
jgi:hypothetical protein